jgi:TRAP-type C4-dicarboxylate transport system permease small subunit
MKPVLATFGHFVNFLEKVQVWAGILSVAVIGVIIPLQVFCRFILNAPLMWPEDVGIGLMVWLGFIGSAVLYKRKEHVAVDYFKNYFPPKWAKGVALGLDLLIGFLTLLIIIYGYQLNLLQMMTMQVGTGIPRGFFYSLPLLVNMIFMLIYNLYIVLERLVFWSEAETKKP